MHKILKCYEEEWYFAKAFTYIDNEINHFRYNLFKKYKKRERIQYLVIDDEGMMINLTNIKGNWTMISWDEIKTTTLYYTMNPYDCLSLAFEQETNERIKITRYLEDLRKQYPSFNERFYSIYDDKFSLYFHCKKRNIQLQIPPSWIDGGELLLLKDWIEEKTNEKIETQDDEKLWEDFFQ